MASREIKQDKNVKEQTFLLNPNDILKSMYLYSRYCPECRTSLRKAK